MILADASNPSPASLVNVLVYVSVIAGGWGTFALWLQARKKQEVSVEQPVHVRVHEELHRTFASKQEFDEHVRKCHRDDAEIWREINAIKKEILETTKEIQQVTSQTLATLANAKKILGGDR